MNEQTNKQADDDTKVTCLSRDFMIDWSLKGALEYSVSNGVME